MSNFENVEVLEFDEKKNTNKSLIIIIFILIVLFGIGLFFFLRFAKYNHKIVLKNKVVELGDKLDTDIKQYSNNTKNCKIDLSKVDMKKVGKYKYVVTCKKKKATATIEVKDTTAPKITLKTLNIKPTDKFEAQDFVESSSDLSNVNLKIKDKILPRYEKGVYIITIEASDDYNNKTEDKCILIVSDLISKIYFVASNEDKTNYDAKVTISDKIGFNTSDYFNNAIRIYEYKFKNKKDYDKALEEYDKTNKIENNSGFITNDDTKLIIKIIKYLEHDELNDINGYFPYTYSDINILYNKLGYTTKLEK